MKNKKLLVTIFALILLYFIAGIVVGKEGICSDWARKVVDFPSDKLVPVTNQELRQAPSLAYDNESKTIYLSFRKQLECERVLNRVGWLFPFN